ncbi:LysR family transcriptional regulator [Kushneria aurantia]|uniref:LysR family transcriptional regulator n=1 Tax=Kushneria aurantia TaxID=504092 RepID=A0ABV6FZE0_9GAMM|nr:LysR substrate-binding domain-containing protein [Kushneria aurantia]
MELRHLRYFVAVAENLHFGQAARQLNISQPPLSSQIKNLEEEVEVQLLIRNNKEVRLTPAGKNFLTAAKNCIATLERDIAVTRRIAEGKQGSVSIGFSGTMSFHLVPEIVKNLNEHHPDIDIQLQQLTTHDQVASLLHGDIDVGFLVSPVLDDRIDTVAIVEEPFVACLPETHELAQAIEPLNLGKLSCDAWVMTPREAGHGYYDAVLALCNGHGFSPHVVQNAQEQQTLVALVAAEVGVALLPASAACIINERVVFKTINSDVKKINSMAWNPALLTDVGAFFVSYIRANFIGGTKT